MSRTIPEIIDIKLKDGFLPEIDIFDRAKFGTKLLATIKESGGQIIALEGPSGEGKTTFAKMWQGLLDFNGIDSIYFDAFAADFAESPYLALVGEIYEQFNQKNKIQGKKFGEIAKRAGGVFFNTATNIALNLATGAFAGMIGSQIDISKIIKQMKKAQENSISDYIKEWKQKKGELEQFRDTLNTIASQGEDKLLVVIIDELDRCKPSYALELIEILKHLFTVSSVVCLLVLNREILNKMISIRYGQIDSDRYMMKFIHKWYELPSRDKAVDFENPKSFIDYNFQFVFKEQQEFKNTYLVRSCLGRFSYQLGLSLRDIQMCIYLILSSYREKVVPYNNDVSLFIVFLAITKVMIPHKYNGVATGALDLMDAYKDSGFSLEEKRWGINENMLSILGAAFEGGIPRDAWLFARSVIEGT